ncbi:tRNA-uridine aminocarboxypropyltransferase [Marinimicrobium agarilyticum]|uniref:tRNA-uridine aminocarboxypropyltransferase n=1 Tax=Marinimicrobium agarilyticum TaxID=306546 RepID=UPI00041DAF81|nr:tRNA-uridine aminocarboxypropyltransferase [Marinimicrobium agarilyticum]
MSRALCPRCQRPVRACLCQWIRPTPNEAALLILQHPSEVSQAKNSAGLLSLSLARCETHVGEQWPEHELQALLDPNRQPLLLYPDTDDLPAPGLDTESATAPRQWQLIVLDGTWRKSRKMLYLNPLLQRLPRLALTDTPASRYRIRRARKPGQLSTLEASCYALAHLEGGRVAYSALLEAFDGFNEQHLAFRPSQP